MSRAASLTPEEEIRKKATLSDALFNADLEVFAKIPHDLQRNALELAHTREELAAIEALDVDIKQLYALNANARLVGVVKHQAEAHINSFKARQMIELTEQGYVDRFKELLQKYPDNIALQGIEKYRYVEPASHVRAAGESKDDRRRLGSAEIFRDAIVQVLNEIKEAEIYARKKIILAKNYYKSVMMEYLRITMYDNYKTATRLDEKHPAVDNILRRLNEMLHLPDEQEGIAQFEAELKKIHNTNYTLPIKDNKGKEVVVKVNLVNKQSQIKKLLDLEKILTGKYSDFNQFEADMAAFRAKQQSMIGRGRNLLYSLLPDVTPKIKDDYFPLIKTEKDNYNYTAAYREYARLKRDASLTRAEDDELKKLYEVIASSVDAAIKNNFSDNAMTALMTNLREAVGINKEGLWMVVAIMKKVLAANSSVSNDLSDAKLIAILQDRKLNTIVDFIGALDKYAATENHVHHQALKNHISMMAMQTSTPPELIALMNNPAKLAKFKVDIVKYTALKATEEKAEKMTVALQQVMTDSIDMPLIDLLRAQVLHAAKLYFNPPPEQAGVMHWLHHGFTGDANILQLIYDLFSPNIKSFSDAMQCLHESLTRHAQTHGLHTNSFDTLLSYVLYNEGKPLGLFHMKLADIVKTNLKPIYPDYRANDSHYRPAHAKITKDDVKAITEYLNQHYRLLPELSMSGVVGSMVRGQNRLEKTEQRHIVRDQLGKNLVRMAQLVEQFKAGQIVEAKIEDRPAAARK